MGTYSKAIGYATAVAGYDLLTGETYKSSQSRRKVMRLGYVGSAAVADTQIDLYYGDTKIGTFFNTTAGASKVPMDEDMQVIKSGWINSKGEDISVKVVIAPGTNQVLLKLEISEFP